MRIVITGAGGFVGRKLSECILDEYEVSSLVLMDTNFNGDTPLNDSPKAQSVRYVEGNLQDSAVRRAGLEQGVDILYHMATVPGGAAEGNPSLSKAVNLDASLALFDEAADAGNCPRIVYTSTIAVLGAPDPTGVNDATKIAPEMIYGTHKAMCELALADMHRRKLVDAVIVRLSGIVARPAAASGLKSAFMSNIFHALKACEPFVCPVSEAATMWLMSMQCCVKNLAHAGRLESGLMPGMRAVTLPAIRCRMDELAKAIANNAGVSSELVSYEPDTALEELFGSLPVLEAPAAELAGFVADENIVDLVSSALDV